MAASRCPPCQQFQAAKYLVIQVNYEGENQGQGGDLVKELTQEIAMNGYGSSEISPNLESIDKLGIDRQFSEYTRNFSCLQLAANMSSPTPDSSNSTVTIYNTTSAAH